MSNRKSCRPCSRSVGTVREWRCEREERAASVLATAGVTSPCSSACAVWTRAGSQCAIGTAWERIPIRPGLRDAVRIERGSKVGPRDRRHDRLEGNAGDRRVPDLPAAEREPEGSDLGVRDVASAGEPVEEVLRVLHLPRPVEPELAAGGAGAAGVAGERGEADLRPARVPIGSMSAYDWPSPWKRMTPGQPPAGAVPLGMMYAHASGVESEASIVTVGPARRGRGAPGAHERCGEDGEDDPRPTHEANASAHLRCSPWTRVP